MRLKTAIEPLGYGPRSRNGRNYHLYHLILLTPEEPWMSEEELELIAEALDISEEELEPIAEVSDISEEEFNLTVEELGISEEKLEFIAEEEGVSKREVAKVLELSMIVQHIERVARDAGLSFEKTKSILYRSCINQAPCFINYPSDLLNNEESPREESSEEESFQRIGGKDVEFTMGSPRDEEDRNSDERQADVIISKAFEMMTTEVTQQMWFDVMKKNPSRFKTPDDCDNHLKIGEEDLCPDHPVERVSWDDVQTYIAKRNEAKGLTGCWGTPNGPKGCLRLPTEAEWEYAARGGATTVYSFGDDHSGLIEDYAWYRVNSGRKTHPVKTRMANPYGLHDMYGNVWEWVQDYWTKNLPGGRDPLVITGKSRVYRGGSWSSWPWLLRSAGRNSARPRNKGGGAIGFRLVRNL